MVNGIILSCLAKIPKLFIYSSLGCSGKDYMLQVKDGCQSIRAVCMTGSSLYREDWQTQQVYQDSLMNQRLYTWR